MTLRATLYDERTFATMDVGPTSLPIIDPWMPPGSLTLLFGPPSAGKSMMTTTIAHALTDGAMLWGTFPCTPCRVLIVQADMNTAMYQERLKAQPVTSPDVLLLLTDAMPFDVCKLSPSDPVIVQARAFGPRVVFVDTLRKTHPYDENDSTAADRVYAAWRTLFPDAAFVFLHHTRKVPAQTSSSDNLIREAFRGNSAWAASADTLMMMRRVRKANNPNWMTRAFFVRTRACEEPRPLLLKRSEALTLDLVEADTIENRFIAWLGDNPRASKAEATNWLREVRDSTGKLMCSKATAYRLFARIVEK